MYPLPLYLLPYPAELALAMMQPKVLVEATQHLRQMSLLLPPSPVSMCHDPIPCAGEELPTTLGTGYTNQSEAP